MVFRSNEKPDNSWLIEIKPGSKKLFWVDGTSAPITKEMMYCYYSKGKLGMNLWRKATDRDCQDLIIDIFYAESFTKES
jgi:hypothetical protein